MILQCLPPLICHIYLFINAMCGQLYYQNEPTGHNYASRHGELRKKKGKDVHSSGVLCRPDPIQQIGTIYYMVRTKETERIIAKYKLTMNNNFRCSVYASQQIFSSAAVVALISRPNVFHSQSATGLHNMTPHRKWWIQLRPCDFWWWITVGYTF